MHKLGIDLGGTKIEGIILDPQGKEIFRKRIKTEQEKGRDHILSQIKKIYDLMVNDIKNEKHSLGIGTPGALSLKTGLLKNSNTVCLNETPVKQDLEKILGRKFEMQNDANCFAFAEALNGAGKGYDFVFGVIMGTGCGGGIVQNEKVRVGPQAIAGEWGHMSIDPRGPKCYCGNQGCVETLISGGGLEALYKKEFGESLALKDILIKAGKEDPGAWSFIQIFMRNFGLAIANVINILDPDVIVLGGGVSNVGELYTLGVQHIEEFVFNDSLETKIVKNKLGDSAGVIGAALIGI